MKEVKEKQRMKAPKTQDPMRRMPRTAERAYRKINEVIPAGEDPYDSPSDYAVQKSEEYTQETADRAYHGAKKTIRKTKDEIRDIHDRIRGHREERQYEKDHSAESPDSHQPDASHEPAETQGGPPQPYSERPAPKTRDPETERPSDAPIRHTPESGTEPEYRTPTAQKQREILEQRYGHEPSANTSGNVPTSSEPPANTFGSTSATSEPMPSGQTRNQATPVKEGGYHHATQPTETQIRSVQSGYRPVSAEKTAAQQAVVRERQTLSSVKQVPQRAVKGTEKTVKTADRTVKAAKTTVKTAEKTAKAAEKTAKTAEKAAKAAKEAAVKAAQAAAKAAEYTAKAIEAAVKAIIAAIKELIAAIAAGGWVAVVVILIVALIALLVCTCFGLFWSNDAAEGTSMTEIIVKIDQGYKSAIDKRIDKFEREIDHDEFEVVYRGDNNDGDSATVNNWIDVLAVYSVLSTTGDNPIIILTPDDDCEQQLRDVFGVMNTVGFTYELKEEVPEDAPTPTPDENGETPEPDTVTVLIVNVHQKSMTYREAAEYYRFDESQMQMLEEMMSPRYTSYYAKLIGIDLYGGTDYTEIISHLPVNSKGADVVRAALTKVGCPYVWGAKGSTKFDCSGLAYWAIHEVDPTLGDRMYTNAAGQAKYCYDRGLTVGRSELQPGDLVFWVNKKCEGCHRWKEIHHVGIYVGDGKVVEASSSKGCVVVRDLWESKNYPIIMFGRPYQ